MNLSHAVRSQRFEDLESFDDFPTPPWATRALIEHVIPNSHLMSTQNCLEPAAGRGFMSEALKEYFSVVQSFDVFDYGYCQSQDFLEAKINERFDWVITNPPFKLAEEFILKSLQISKVGVAVLVRTVFLESVGRYERLFSKTPPSLTAQFVERVPMVKGRVDKAATTATGYAWLVWLKNYRGKPQLVWVPPCRKILERSTDYIIPNDRVDSVINFNKPSQSLKPSKNNNSIKKAQSDLFSPN